LGSPRTDAAAVAPPLRRAQAGSIFAETHNDAVRRALVDSERISRLLTNATLTVDWGHAASRASAGHGKRFVEQLKQVASVVSARHAFEAEVDVFYVELGGFDSHSDVFDDVDKKFNDINIALEAFVAEMKAQGTWDQVRQCSVHACGRPTRLTRDRSGERRLRRPISDPPLVRGRSRCSRCRSSAAR
jgi:uncharacterized protein (DUF1501 family)